MNTVHEPRSIADPTSVPNLATTVNGHSVLRWLVPCIVVAVTALAVVGAAHLRSAAPATHAAAVHQLIGPEEQAFINRVGRARLAATIGSVPVAATSTGLAIGPEEREFLNKLRVAQLAGYTGRNIVRSASPPLLETEKVFVNRT